MDNRDGIKLHLPEADGIRGFACLIVLVVHSIAITYPQSYPYLTGCGKIGVWLFFILSAYLLTHQFFYKGFSKDIMVNYLISRFFRVYPIFFIAVIAYYLLGTAHINMKRDLFLALSLQGGFAHLWIIPVQLKFYIILPVFAWIGRLIMYRFGLKGIVVGALLFIVFHQVFFPYWELPENSIEMIWYLPVFVFGVVGAFITISSHMPRNRAVYIGLLSLACIFLATPFMRYLLLGMPPTRYLMNKYMYIGFAWMAFIVTQVNTNGELLTQKWLCSIGSWSYSIYLFHFFIVMRLGQLFPQSIITVVVSIILSILFGYVSYSILERNIMGLRKRISVRV